MYSTARCSADLFKKIQFADITVHLTLCVSVIGSLMNNRTCTESQSSQA